MEKKGASLKKSNHKRAKKVDHQLVTIVSGLLFLSVFFLTFLVMTVGS